MAVDYLRDYLGIDPTDYSAMERTIAGVPPVGQSIILTWAHHQHHSKE